MGDTKEKAIVFIHGAGGSAATWFMQLKGLSLDYHTVAVELNGHGKSIDRKEIDVLHSYLGDIHDVVKNLDHPVLAGHSMGGALVQLYALNHPKSLRGIILVGTGARLKVSPMVFDLLDHNFDGYVEALGDIMFHESTSREIVDASKHETRKCSPHIIRRDYELCDSFDIMEEVSHITLPALILVGEGDIMTPAKYSTYLHEKIAGSVMHVISSAGHAVMLEQATIFNNYVSDWMKTLH
ncbi:MAG: alpha/beta fold hydrolase [Promethearchaeota archaeon]